MGVKEKVSDICNLNIKINSVYHTTDQTDRQASRQFLSEWYIQQRYEMLVRSVNYAFACWAMDWA
jgi:hypothetical protein